MSATLLKGSCLCGNNRYTVPLRCCGDPQRIAHCHCVHCRKFHGAAFSTFWETSELTWTSCSSLSQYTAPETGAIRQFCSRCGSSLTFQSGAGSDSCIEFAIATLDSPSAGEDIGKQPLVEPDAHIFYSRKVPWLKFGDGLPKHEEDRPAS